MMAVWQIASFMFDGFKFPIHGAGQIVPFLHMAYKARRGWDAVATELLTVSGTVICDLDGKQYWPLVEDVAPPVPPTSEPNNPGMGIM